MSGKRGRARAVFLDRDGTINREVDLLRDARHLRILPGAAEGIRKLKQLGFLTIVVTNQPVVARGWITEADVEALHRVLLSRLRKKGAVVDAVYYCPHHPDADVARYRIRCGCRKPRTGLIRKAIRSFKIDPSRSFLVGDSTRDILAGKRAGLTTILVTTGYGGRDGRHDVCSDAVAGGLREAARLIARLAGRRSRRSR